MANQVQFIQLSQAEYDNISSKKNGSIYFTTDTHRIYKGGDLYASTTFDTLKFEDLSATSIKVDGVDVSLEGHKHSKADIIDFPTKVGDFENDSGYLTETDLQDIEFVELQAQSLKVNGKDVSVDGHTHTKSEISDFPTNVSSFTNDSGYITIDDVDLTSITSKIPDAASSTNQLADKDFVTSSIQTYVDQMIGQVMMEAF